MTVKLSGPMLAPRSGGPPRRLVVLLHGYGADGQDLIGLGRHWQPLLPEALFVAPNAPTPCTGTPGYQWFPVSLEGDRLARRQDGVVMARPVLLQFLEDLWRQTGLTAADTVLAGFSQGAMMALHTGLSLPEPLLGIIAFSGAFLPPDGFGAGSAYSPVALIHGDMDTLVDPQLSRDAAAALKAAGLEVALHLSPGTAHGIAPDGLDFATAFLRARAATVR